MGRRGPAPKPTAIRILEGNPAHRPLPANEVKPTMLMPDCPDWLPEGAKLEWEKIAPILHRLGLLTEVDQMALAAYCTALSTWRQAQKVLDTKGLIFTTPSGYKQQRPEVAIVSRSLALVRAFSAEFGLSPASRARLEVAPSRANVIENGIAELID
jgi:P27 family predicted phage terminase small subunit